jgi:HlyD family secretion protein
MKFKLTRIALILLVIGGIVLLSAGCAGRSNSSGSADAQTYTVQQGSISIFITGTGNLALKNTQQLSFGQTGLVSQATYARISDVLITRGAIVEKGQVLIKADTKDWQDKIVADQHTLDSVKYNLSQAKAGVTQAETAFLKAQDNIAQAKATVTDAKNNVIAAQSTLDNAQYALSMQTDVKDLQDKIDNANIQLQQAKLMLQTAISQGDSGEAQYWKRTVQYYEEDSNPDSANPKHIPDGGIIGWYKTKMNSLLTDPEHAGVTSSVAEIKTRAAAVKQAENNILVVQQNVVNAQNQVVYAQNAVAGAQNDLDLAKNAVVIAQNKVDEAQKTLDDDKNSSQEIVAPFRGLLTRVNCEKGDIVERSTNLIEIAEPDIFEANVMVTQRDVVSIKIGNEAIVAVDALQGLNFPAKITQIAPLATIQSGVVNYEITVELTSVTPLSAAGTTAAGSPARDAAQITLKDGFSVVARFPILQKDNILIVPSKAISHQGQDFTVQVKTGAATETRIVKTGITDYKNTEIVEGLKPGDQVVLPSIPAPMPSNSSGMFGG